MAGRTFEKAVFLDRDGVINHDPGDYTTTLDDFEILPGTVEKLKIWWQSGWGLIVITNQGGIDKGMYSASEVRAMHQYLQGLCAAQGFAIDAFYFCPHHPEYSGKCLCRKPGSLMIEKAMHHFQLKPANCVMLGDRERDMDSASGAGVRGVLLPINRGIAALPDDPALLW
ncbi:MAG: HAD family hydrolase [Bacteroidetes bacterium]|nr:HAD family hydrolase [Bacteroidota bacterium]